MKAFCKNDIESMYACGLKYTLRSQPLDEETAETSQAGRESGTMLELLLLS